MGLLDRFSIKEKEEPTEFQMEASELQKFWNEIQAKQAEIEAKKNALHTVRQNGGSPTEQMHLSEGISILLYNGFYDLFEKYPLLLKVATENMDAKIELEKMKAAAKDFKLERKAKPLSLPPQKKQDATEERREPMQPTPSFSAPPSANSEKPKPPHFKGEFKPLNFSDWMLQNPNARAKTIKKMKRKFDKAKEEKVD